MAEESLRLVTVNQSAQGWSRRLKAPDVFKLMERLEALVIPELYQEHRPIYGQQHGPGGEWHE